MGLVQDLDAIVWECEPVTLRFTFVSDRAEELLGYPVSAWVDFDSWAGMIHPDDRRGASDLCVRETRAGRDHDFEYRAIAADGRTVWLRDMVRLVHDADGTLTAMRGVIVDVSERKRAEAEQAGLRRVATAVAAGTPAERVFELVAREVATLLSVEAGLVWRFDGGQAVVAGCWSEDGPAVGTSATLGSSGALAKVAAGGEAARTRYDDLDPDDPAGGWVSPHGFHHGVAAPVRAGGRLWGAVLAATASPHEPPDDSEERLARFAELVALAIANAEDRVALAQRAAAQATLRRVATAVAAASDSPELYALVCREAAELLGGEAAGLVRLTEPGMARVINGWSRPGVAVPERGRVVRLRPASVRALRSGVPVVFGPDDGTTPDQPWRRRLARGVVAPIVVHGEPWGILTVSGAEALPAGAEDTIRHFADLVATAAVGARQRRALSDHAREQEALRHLTTMAAEGAPPPAIIATAADQVAKLLGVGPGLVLRYTDLGAEVLAAVGTGHPVVGTVFPYNGSGPVAEVARTGRPARISGYLAPTVAPGDAPPWGETRWTGIAAPVRTRGDLWGAVLSASEDAADLPPGLEERLARFASVLGVALASAEDRAELSTRAATDPLTGLANHRTFQERLRDEFERALRHGRHLSLALFDIDHFKATNDRHGHQAGDRLLVAVARLLRDHARAGDLVARVGGDELAWIMPETDGLDAWQAAERMRLELGGVEVTGVRGVGASAGVCEVAHARDPGDLYRLADGALYWAKVHGRGACFRYTPDVVAVLSAEERAERLEREQALTSVRLLARVVDAKDPSTRRHSERVAETAGRLAALLGWPAGHVAALREAGLVHDVGKVGVPDAVLFKPGRLTPGEYDQVKGHAVLGAQLVSEVLSADQVSWVRHHHERWDGAGYPDALAGDAIPEGARILAVADAWDVMTNVRQYKLPMPVDEALAECRRERGSQFCPSVVGAMEQLVASGGLPAPHDVEPSGSESPDPSFARR